MKEEYQIKTNAYCKRCHRKLKTEDAKSLGYGKICWEKIKQANEKFLFEVNNETIK